MSITSSLNAGVSGLNANAARLASISDNISNASTFGYRRAETDFEALVIGSSAGKYTAGGVKVATTRAVTQGGSLVATANALDLAVNGGGMLPVRDYSDATGGGTSLLLTPTGSFSRDASGYVTTDSGLVLLGWPLSADGTLPNVPRDSTAGLEPIKISANQRSADPTTRITVEANLPAALTKAGSAATTHTMTAGYFGNLGNSETLTIDFSPTVPASGSSNTWTMTIRDSAQNGAVIGEYTLEFSSLAGTGGTLAAVTMVSGGAYVPGTGTIPLSVAGGTINLTIGKIGESAGITQLDSQFTVGGVESDGAPPGSLTGMEVDEQGFLIATYDTGFSKKLYQIPLVSVPNMNGLGAGDRQTFSVTRDSGAFLLWEPGTGPTGTISGYTREGSATDTAAELTALIQTQRAYSSNAKVITTVALSFALPTVLPVEISDCTLASPPLIDFSVCSATIALLFVRIEVISFPFSQRCLWHRFRQRLLSLRSRLPAPSRVEMPDHQIRQGLNLSCRQAGKSRLIRKIRVISEPLPRPLCPKLDLGALAIIGHRLFGQRNFGQPSPSSAQPAAHGRQPPRVAFCRCTDCGDLAPIQPVDFRECRLDLGRQDIQPRPIRRLQDQFEFLHQCVQPRPAHATSLRTRAVKMTSASPIPPARVSESACASLRKEANCSSPAPPPKVD